MKELNSIDRCVFCGSTELYIPCIVWSASFFVSHQIAVCSNCLDCLSAREFWETLFQKAESPFPPDFCPNEWEYGNTRYIKPDTASDPNIQTERSKMSNSLRYKVMRRDRFHCVLCGATGKDDQLVIDHVLPVSRGGKTVIENLRTLCFTCNSGKRDEVE